MVCKYDKGEYVIKYYHQATSPVWVFVNSYQIKMILLYQFKLGENERVKNIGISRGMS
jgi:hypothetical protein